MVWLTALQRSRFPKTKSGLFENDMLVLPLILYYLVRLSHSEAVQLAGTRQLHEASHTYLSTQRN